MFMVVILVVDFPFVFLIGDDEYVFFGSRCMKNNTTLENDEGCRHIIDSDIDQQKHTITLVFEYGEKMEFNDFIIDSSLQDDVDNFDSTGYLENLGGCQGRD